MTSTPTPTPRTATNRSPVVVPEVGHPVPPSRVRAVDAARGLALLGMMTVYVLTASGVTGRPTTVYSVATGPAAALFALLVGVSVSLVTGRRRVPWRDLGPHAAAFTTRGALLVALGVLLLGDADPRIAVVVLPYYGLLYLLAVPLVCLPSWAVAGLAVIVVTGGPALTHVLLPRLPLWSPDNIGLADVLRDPAGVGTGLLVTGQFPALTWSTYLVVGIALGRLDLLRFRSGVALLVGGTTLAAGSAVASSWLWAHGARMGVWTAQPRSHLTPEETRALLAIGGDGTAPPSTWWWLAVDSPHTGTPPDLVRTTGAAVAVLGLCVLVEAAGRRWRMHGARLLLGPLAAAGSMTLTLYVAHVLFLNSANDPVDRPTSLAVQVTAALLGASAWVALVGRGPLEADVRVVTRRAAHLAGRGGAR